MKTIQDRCTTAIIGTEPYETRVSITGEVDHALIADVPPGEGGKGKGPTPHELLEASIAACKAITVRMYADRKGWPLESATARTRHDIRSVDGTGPKMHHFDCELELTGDLTDEQRSRLLEIAGRCSIHKILQSEPVFATELIK